MTSPENLTPTSSPASQAEASLQRHRDLLFDLTAATASSDSDPTEIFHRTMRGASSHLIRLYRKNTPQDWERAVVLQIFCEQLRKTIPSLSGHFSNREQIELDETATATDRLRRLGDFFHLLSREDKMLLTLSERHSLRPDELAIALQVPEKSTQFRRGRALAQLERQVWPAIPSSQPECAAAEFWMNEAPSVDSMESSPTEIRAHLQKCDLCKERAQRWQLVAAHISTLPRSPLPQSMRKKSVRNLLRNPSETGGIYSSLPWYVKAPLEGFAVVAILLTITLSAPRIKNAYDRWQDPSIPDLNALREETSPESDSPAPTTAEAEAQTAANRDEFASEESDEDSTPDLDPETESIATAAENAYVMSDSGEKIRVTKSDIWRFMIRSDQPQVLRTKISDTLSGLGLPKDLPGLKGIVAPGGIQFDVLVPPQSVPRIKQDLERMSLSKGQPQNDDTQSSFSWYKSRSRKKNNERNVRVVIWISQI